MSGAKPKRTVYEVKKVIGKTWKNGELHYKLLWEGYKKPSIEPAKECFCPDLIKRFENEEKMKAMKKKKELKKREELKRRKAARVTSTAVARIRPRNGREAPSHSVTARSHKVTGGGQAARGRGQSENTINGEEVGTSDTEEATASSSTQKNDDNDRPDSPPCCSKDHREPDTQEVAETSEAQKGCEQSHNASIVESNTSTSSQNPSVRISTIPLPPVFSRACGICCSASPRQRSVFTGCGHLVCRACAEKMSMDALPPLQPVCPFCRKESKTVKLLETRDDCDSTFDIEPKKGSISGTASWATFREELALAYLNGKLSCEMYEVNYHASLEHEARNRDRIEKSRRALCDVEDEEYYRIDAALPQGASRGKLAAGAAEVVRRREIERFIKDLKLEDKLNCSSSRGHYSRACGICDNNSPRDRSVFTACGHAVCRSCAEKIQNAWKTQGVEPACPFLCPTYITVMNLFEESD